MKKYIFILLVGLLNCQLAIFAQKPKYIEKKICVCSDTTIIVRELFGEDCKLYGDSILREDDRTKKRFSKDRTMSDTCSYTKYGGDSNDLFNKNMKEVNWNKEEYNKYVSRNGKGIVIELNYKNIPPDTGLNFRFYGALYDDVLRNKNSSWSSLEWYRDKMTIYCVLITKKDTTVTEIPPADPVAGYNTNGSNDDETKSLQTAKLIVRILTIIFILTIICLFIAIFVHINKLNKKIILLQNNQKQSPRQSEYIDLDKIKQTLISKIKSEELVQRISNEDIYGVVARSDIQLYIQTIIAGKVDEYLRNNKITNPIPAGISSGSNQQPPVVQSELRTTKVEYRADNNCFVISENSQNKIFEIYSINGEYFYTIVNDSSIRKEMLGFITAFSGYVETRQASPIPSTVEVIRDGRLIKNGDMYIVDTNCILQVSLM